MNSKQKKKINFLSLLSAILITVGRPFYFILSHIFITLAFTFYIISNVIRKIKLPKLPKRKIHKIIYPVFKITLPKLNINLHIKKHYVFFISFLTFLIFISYFLILKNLPSPSELTTRQIDVSTKIYDRNDNLLYTIYKDKNRTPVKLSQIPENVRLATLAAEDAEFYDHIGFSVRGTIRAIIKNFSEGRLQGGSTITQQLVKNALLSSEKTYIRKVRELILSIGVEMSYSKDEIFEMYLNEVNYGGNVYGIEEASQHYFAKHVEELTLSEASLLAGLPQSPTRYSPFGNNPELTFSRQREILYLMRVNKFISTETEEKTVSERVTFTANRQNILAPHFVMYVKEKLIDEYGEEVVLKGGLTVKTTLDLNIQMLAEKVAREEIEKLKNLKVENTGIIVLDPKNGDILAMVGSVDYFDTKNDGNVNVTTRLRQPGSSIKVINYAEALSNGLTLASIIDDSPVAFNVAGQKPYIPKNYDGAFKGKITVRQALAQSRNIPAVKILASYGVGKMIDLGEKMGISSWKDRSRFGLSLTLGGGETKLLDMAKVYSVIANMGIKNEIQDITEVKNYQNKVLFKSNEITNLQEKILDSRIAFLLIDVLEDNIARSPAFGTNSMLVIPNHPEVAVKTGTSNGLKDNLTIGFNKDYLVAVWVGNNNGSSMSRIASGITGAAPIWNKIMRTLLIDKPSVAWNAPEGLVYKECFSRNEWFLEEKQLACPKIIEPATSIINTEVSVQ
ncbi:MAG: 1A family penicillin-binding protein [uncultured bacterium]|nr:MAG: 1A family penicillin-binding protein [uncultured bacterium]